MHWRSTTGGRGVGISECEAPKWRKAMNKIWVGDKIYITDEEVAGEIEAQRAEILRLRNALRNVSRITTPWVDGRPNEATLDELAAYADEVLHRGTRA